MKPVVVQKSVREQFKEDLGGMSGLEKCKHCNSVRQEWKVHLRNDSPKENHSLAGVIGTGGKAHNATNLKEEEDEG
ncbi:Pdz Domain-Containing Ring Finger Protein 4 [Manis pentadactyla]|nr:Pdz Domain-Containing Ring Finger Protein 4 [Manis pentadactyla]